VLALLSIEGVRECVQKAGAQCAQLPVTNREQALAFVADASCMSVLDLCLAFGEPFPPSTGGGSSSGCDGCNGCNGCDGCDGCDGCSDDCSDCNNNCSECNDNCSDCNQNCSDCNQNASACKSCSGSRCSIRPEQRLEAQGNEPPAGTFFMLAAPVMFLFRRSRRRS